MTPWKSMFFLKSWHTSWNSKFLSSPLKFFIITLKREVTDFFWKDQIFPLFLFYVSNFNLLFFILFLKVHFVHFNKKYNNAGEALDKPDGLLVVGNFIQVMKNNCLIYLIYKKKVGIYFGRRKIQSPREIFSPTKFSKLVTFPRLKFE